ncbi:InlB B-repeat-containing protein [Pontibacter korlensis]|uniref:InlB B-repeat-containing protein n=1 Tax=Pontibacter korlensis TaxID=400092 RepID=UPI000696187B|nr:T9SS type A sorting domain-containing protein [Pontibacter korlensis]
MKNKFTIMLTLIVCIISFADVVAREIYAPFENAWENSNTSGLFSTQTEGQQVTSFTLVDSHTELDIRTIADGEVISLADLPHTKLNVRANTSPATVGSVKFELSGTQSKTYTDNAAPYALHGDNGSGNYYYGNWNPPATGTYTLKATPYSGAKGSGTAGTPLTVTFTVTEQGTTPPEQSFTLAVSATSGGSVAKSPDQASYASGSTVTLTATPQSGYQFSGWSGDASGSTNPLSVTMNADKSITANFTQNPTDQTPPTVVSIKRQSPTTSTTSATSVVYRATFSESVSGVDKDDFMTTVTSGTLSATIASVAASGTGGTTFDVTVNSIEGNGTLRLDLKNSGTGIQDAAGNAVASGYTSGETYTIQPSSGTEGFVSVTKLGTVPVHINLGDQPQSKVWTYQGKWWAVLPETGTGTHIWRLDGTTWTKVSTITTSAYTKADCKVVDNVVHIFLYRGESLASELVSVEYDAASASYKTWSQRSAKTTVQLDLGVKTATIDVDGNGRMWLVSNGNNNVYARWSDAPYTSWSAPVTIFSGITSDDISAVIYMPALKKTGILWSNQNTKRFGFKTHNDTTDPASWSADEVPAGHSAIESGDGMADDHLNMAIASDGTLYCAVKTGYRDENPEIAMLVRRPSGSWDSLYGVSDDGNRPIVILNEALGKVKIVYAARGAAGIFYKESHTSNISFGAELPLINETCDYATSMKDNYSSDIVIFASSSNQAYSVLASDEISATSTSNIVAATKAAEEELIAYPNPFQYKATINFTLDEGDEYALVLYDVEGNQVSAEKQGIGVAGGVNKVEIDGSALPKGLYLVRLITPYKTKTVRLMLNK